MQILAGTSGYAFKEWSGSFYPEELKDGDRLGFYAGALPCVEINNTFYRTPKRTVVAGWRDQVPEGFVFSMKASRRITHVKRLKDVEEPVFYNHRSSLEFGDRLGAVLLQLPPSFRKDTGRLAAFLEAAPDGWPMVFEFRHESWEDDEIHTLLADHGVALCANDETSPEPVLHATGAFGYVRLRGENYSDEELDEWIERLRREPWERALVFFKHEEAGPALAGRMNERAR